MEPPLHGVASSSSPPVRPRHDRYLSFSYSPPSSAGDELTEDDIFNTAAETEASPNPSPHPHHQPRHHHHQNHGILAALPASETRSVFNHKASATASVASSTSSTSSTSSPRAIPSIHRRPPARGRLMQQSAPVDVPILSRRRGADYASEEEEEEEGVEVQMLPPHEMVAARDSPVVACSVLEGVGRTLKGRDLRRVRNAVFRKTGFID